MGVDNGRNDRRYDSVLFNDDSAAGINRDYTMKWIIVRTWDFDRRKTIVAEYLDLIQAQKDLDRFRVSDYSNDRYYIEHIGGIDV